MGMKSLEEYRVDFIDVIKRTMATNLIAKGISASDTDSLQALADKIANVTTGKKWASGTTASVGYILTISGLNFSPSKIIAKTGAGATAYYTTVNFTENYRYHISQDGNYAVYYNDAGTRNADGCVISMPLPNAVYTWEAFE